MLSMKYREEWKKDTKVDLNPTKQEMKFISAESKIENTSSHIMHRASHWRCVV